jgi:hypothetical protein
MLEPLSPRDRADFYYRQLPQAVRRELNEHGIPDTFIEKYALGWNGKAITIPIANREGNIVFFKFARSPLSGSHGSATQAEPTNPVELYGWDTLLRQPSRVVISGGELDRLILEAHGFPSVASTGAENFQEEWARHFEGIDHVYVCLARGDAGARGAERIAAFIPKARVVEFPEEVGETGDVTDYFVRLKKSRTQFEALLRAADVRVAQKQEAEQPMPSIGRAWKRAERLKGEVSISFVIGRYTNLRHAGAHLLGRCPLHEDKRPSLHVYPETQSFHCFGCGEGGDVLTFLQKKENLTFGQALEALEKIRYSNEYPAA